MGGPHWATSLLKFSFKIDKSITATSIIVNHQTVPSADWKALQSTKALAKSHFKSQRVTESGSEKNCPQFHIFLVECICTL